MPLRPAAQPEPARWISPLDQSPAPGAASSSATTAASTMRGLGVPQVPGEGRGERRFVRPQYAREGGGALR
nr:hypothetical protein [Streptomyces sp. TLI_235]